MMNFFLDQEPVGNIFNSLTGYISPKITTFTIYLINCFKPCHYYIDNTSLSVKLTRLIVFNAKSAAFLTDS